MVNDTLEEFISSLAEDGSLKNIEVEVDPGWEISAIMRLIFQKPPEKRPAVAFHNIKGHNLPLVVGLYGNKQRYAKAIGATVDTIAERWSQAILERKEPLWCEGGTPCQEIVHQGKEVDLTRLPIPTWVPGKDAAPYITAGCVTTRDPETGWVNVGIYRLMLKGPNKLAIHLDMVQHIGDHFRKWQQLGKAMPVAITLGAGPVMPLVAATKIPPVGELAVAGGFYDRPIEITRCVTVDLPVPIFSQIVIEGEIPPDVRELEGPFGEFHGYMGNQLMNPVINVKAITMRSQPIFHAILSQKPPSESSIIRGTGREASALHELRNMGFNFVKDVHFTEGSCSHYHVVISVDKVNEFTPRQAMLALWSIKPLYCKQIVVVDSDVNVRDASDVEWAVATRARADKDYFPMEGLGAVLIDPLPREEPLVEAKIGIDATRKGEYTAVSLIGSDYLERARQKASAYGLDL